jgi:hypothetical protein
MTVDSGFRTLRLVIAGNSGVYLHGKYEIQVLDSCRNPTYAVGACGPEPVPCVILFARKLDRRRLAGDDLNRLVDLAVHR